MYKHMLRAFRRSVLVVRPFSSLAFPTSGQVPSLVIEELKKAKIRCTNQGVQLLNEAFSSSDPSILDDTTGFCKTFSDAWMASDVDTYSLASFHRSGESPWRPNGEAFRVFIDSKVYRMWEALHLASPVFRKMIDEEERSCEEDMRFNGEGWRVDDEGLWRWMALVIEDGLVDRRDIEALPDPIDTAALDVPLLT